MVVLSVTSISAGREGDNPQSWLQASSLCCWWRGAARSVGMCILDHLFPFKMSIQLGKISMTISPFLL